MKQLEIKTYSRSEIAEITGISISDTKNFKRNIESKLSNWGYRFIYKRKEVEIIDIPRSAEERFKEIMIRDFNVRADTNFYLLAVFIYLLMKDDYFCLMPWVERERYLFDKYGIFISESTLKRYFKLLEDNGLTFQEEKRFMYWKTYYDFSGNRVRKPIYPHDKETLKKLSEYQKERKQLLDTGMKYQEVFFILWNKYNTAYYACKKITLNSLGLDGIYIFELSEEIAEGK